MGERRYSFSVLVIILLSRTYDELKRIRDADATQQENLRLSREVTEVKQKLEQIKVSGKKGAEKRALRSEAALEKEKQKCKRLRLEKKSTYNLLR